MISHSSIPTVGETECWPVLRLDPDSARVARAIRLICDRYQIALNQVTDDLAEDFLEEEGDFAFLDQRESPRFDADIPFLLEPIHLEATGKITRFGEDAVAMSRNLSSHGIGFHCDGRLTSDDYLAEFDLCDSTTIQLVLQIRWRQRHSRFSSTGGARIIGLAVAEPTQV